VLVPVGHPRQLTRTQHTHTALDRALITTQLSPDQARKLENQPRRSDRSFTDVMDLISRKGSRVPGPISRPIPLCL
jgi:hypothetical protein